MADDFSRDIVALLPNLRRFALSLARSRDVADDLVQIACERAFAARASFTPGTRLDAWLFRILRNAWIDQIRRRTTEGVRVAIEDAPAARVVDGTAAAESRLMLASTAAAIDQLPDDQRQVLLLVCVEGLAYKDAAAVLEVPIGTVMSRLARARIAIARAMGIN